MSRWMPLSLSLGLVLAACTEADDGEDAGNGTETDGPGADGACDALEGVRQNWLISSLRWGRVEGDVSDGFDLDGDSGQGGCGGRDFEAPDGRPGIDNAFGGLLPVLEATEFAAAEGVIQELIKTGEILIVPELTGIDSLTDDDCVGLSLRRGAGKPLLGTDGELLPMQTLDLDADFSAQTFDRMAVVDGSVAAQPVVVDLPVTFLDAELLFRVQQGGIRLDLHEDGTVSGVLAGGIAVEEVLRQILENGVADELKNLAQGALGFAADLAPDENGTCTQLSVVLAFEAEPIFVYRDAFADGE